MKTRFHMKGFALNPALKTEAKGNWPIDWAQRGKV